MPGGIANDPSNQIGYINPGPLPMPQAQPIGNLFSGFNSGVDAVDSFQRKMSEEVTRNDQQKTDLIANDIKRKLAPGMLENALASQDLQAAQIRSNAELQPGMASLALGEQSAALTAAQNEKNAMSDDPETARIGREAMLEHQWFKATGSKAPTTFQIPAGNKGLALQEWFDSEKLPDLEKQISEWQPTDANGVPLVEMKDRKKTLDSLVGSFVSPGVKNGTDTLGSDRDNQARARYADMVEKQLARMPDPEVVRQQRLMQDRTAMLANSQIQNEWIAAKQEVEGEMRAIKKGSPEYADHIQTLIQGRQESAIRRAQNLQAEPKLKEIEFKAKMDEAADVRKDARVQEEKVAMWKLQQPAAERKERGDAIDRVNTLYKSSDPLKAYNKEAGAIDKIESLVNSGRTFTNTDDIALLYEYVKLLDPASAVREGEIKLSQSANPTLVNLVNRFNALFVAKNKIMSPGVRKDLINTVRTLKSGADSSALPDAKRVATLALDQNVPLELALNESERNLLARDAATPGGLKISGKTPEQLLAEQQKVSAAKARMVRGPKDKIWNGQVFATDPQGRRWQYNPDGKPWRVQ
jgi:hypothetical protein